jgi:hypothetical protein
MFSVKWLSSVSDGPPIETETDLLQELPKIVSSCQRRLPAMRLKYPHNPPAGFVIFGSDGEEVRRYSELPARE